MKIAQIATLLGVTDRTVKRLLRDHAAPSPTRQVPSPATSANVAPSAAEFGCVPPKRETPPVRALSTATPRQPERGRILKESLRRLNRPATFPHSRYDEAPESWYAQRKVVPAREAFASGLVRVTSPDGAISKMVEAAEAPTYEERGWTLVSS